MLVALSKSQVVTSKASAGCGSPIRCLPRHCPGSAPRAWHRHYIPQCLPRSALSALRHRYRSRALDHHAPARKSECGIAITASLVCDLWLAGIGAAVTSDLPADSGQPNAGDNAADTQGKNRASSDIALRRNAVAGLAAVLAGEWTLLRTASLHWPGRTSAAGPEASVHRFDPSRNCRTGSVLVRRIVDLPSAGTRLRLAVGRQATTDGLSCFLQHLAAFRILDSTRGFFQLQPRVLT